VAQFLSMDDDVVDLATSRCIDDEDVSLCHSVHQGPTSHLLLALVNFYYDDYDDIL
jgi:hypothetical protein